MCFEDRDFKNKHLKKMCEGEYRNWKGLCGFFCSKAPLSKKDKKDLSEKADARFSNGLKYIAYGTSGICVTVNTIGTGLLWYYTGWGIGLTYFCLTVIPFACVGGIVGCTQDTRDYYKRNFAMKAGDTKGAIAVKSDKDSSIELKEQISDEDDKSEEDPLVEVVGNEIHINV